MSTDQARVANTEPSHSDETDGLGPCRLLIWVAIGLSLYVLSTGPAIKAARLSNSTMLGNILFAAYYPLGAVADRSPLAEHFFNWYIGEVWKV